MNQIKEIVQIEEIASWFPGMDREACIKFATETLAKAKAKADAKNIRVYLMFDIGCIYFEREPSNLRGIITFVDPLTVAEQTREKTKANQLALIRKAINDAVEVGKFQCEGDGHLIQDTLDAIRKEGFIIQNRNVAYTAYWLARW